MAKDEEHKCFKNMKKELKTWQKKTKFFHYDDPTQNRNPAMYELEGILDDIDEDNCSANLVDGVQSVQIELAEYLSMYEEMKDISEEVKQMDDDSEIKQEMIAKLRQLHYDKGMSYGDFSFALTSFLSEMGVKLQFE